MTAYVPITDAEIEPEKPITTSLQARLRDNAIAIAEGHDDAPRIKPYILHVAHSVASGTDADALAGGWAGRTLNGVVFNDIDGASLATGTPGIVTLPAGIYDVQIWAGARGTTVNVRHQSRLYDVTNAAEVLNGQSCQSAPLATSYSMVRGRITVSVPTLFRVETWTATASGGGNAVGSGSNERHVDAIFEKVA